MIDKYSVEGHKIVLRKRGGLAVFDEAEVDAVRQLIKDANVGARQEEEPDTSFKAGVERGYRPLIEGEGPG